jgi:outer membrane lipoprotein SlyB
MHKLLLATVVAAGLVGCATHDPNVRHRADSQRLAQVQEGTVVSVRSVRLEGRDSGVGGALGMVGGAVAGSHVGGQREAPVFAFLGAVLGGVIGHAVERDAGRADALEMIIQLRNGERVAVVQAQGQEDFRPGDAVMIISQGRSARVSRALPPVPPSATRGTNEPEGSTPR